MFLLEVLSEKKLIHPIELPAQALGNRRKGEDWFERLWKMDRDKDSGIESKEEFAKRASSDLKKVKRYGVAKTIDKTLKKHLKNKYKKEHNAMTDVPEGNTGNYINATGSDNEITVKVKRGSREKTGKYDLYTADNKLILRGIDQTDLDEISGDRIYASRPDGWVAGLVAGKLVPMTVDKDRVDALVRDYNSEERQDSYYDRKDISSGNYMGMDEPDPNVPMVNAAGNDFPDDLVKLKRMVEKARDLSQNLERRHQGDPDRSRVLKEITRSLETCRVQIKTVPNFEWDRKMGINRENDSI